MAVREEVEKRRAAALAEPFLFEAAARGGTSVRSGSGNTYLVLPDLTGLPASCSCPDFARARVGTCKHVEAVRLFRDGKKASVLPPPRIPGALAFEPRGGEVLVFDLETQRAFDEVEDRRVDLLGLSLAVVWSYGEAGFRTYREADASALVDRLCAADLVIGFNHERFDLEVLRAYRPGPALDAVRTFDLMNDLRAKLGHRVSLDGCVRATLGAAKSSHGLQAIEWFRQGRLEELEGYCRDDVRLTRDLFDHGRDRGFVLVEKRDARGVLRPFRVEVSWSAPGLPPIAAALPQARAAAGR